MTDYETDETTGEVVRYQHAAAPGRRDMRNPVTDSWTEVVRATSILADQIANTEFVPDGLRGSAPKVTAAMLYGRELGLAPMTALGSVFVIKGKAGLYAETMRALILQQGHDLRVHESTGSRCVLQARRAGQDEWQTFSYTMDEARRAGDAKANSNYATRPVEMLLARCTARMARAVFADVIHGLAAVEELQADEDEQQRPAAVVQQQGPAPTVQRQQRREKPRAAVEAGKPADPGPEQPTETAEDEPRAATAAAQTTPAQVRRQTRREQPRGRTAPGSDAGPGDESGAGGKPADDRGIDPAEPAPDVPATDTEAASSEQVQHLAMHLQRLGIEDRVERLYWSGVAAGRGDQHALETSKDLTRDEAHDAINRLQRLRDRAGLEALGEALGGGDDR